MRPFRSGCRARDGKHPIGSQASRLGHDSPANPGTTEFTNCGLRHYADFVTPGCYVVIEDTNLNGHPVLPGFGPGPMEAVQQFLLERTDFVTDGAQEKFFLTFNLAVTCVAPPMSNPHDFGEAW